MFNLGKRGITFLALSLFLFSFVSASLDVGLNVNRPFVNITGFSTSSTTTNYSLVNVNNSQFLQGKTPADFINRSGDSIINDSSSGGKIWNLVNGDRYKKDTLHPSYIGTEYFGSYLTFFNSPSTNAFFRAGNDAQINYGNSDDYVTYFDGTTFKIVQQPNGFGYMDLDLSYGFPLTMHGADFFFTDLDTKTYYRINAIDGFDTSEPAREYIEFSDSGTLTLYGEQEIIMSNAGATFQRIISGDRIEYSNLNTSYTENVSFSKNIDVKGITRLNGNTTIRGNTSLEGTLFVGRNITAPNICYSNGVNCTSTGGSNNQTLSSGYTNLTSFDCPTGKYAVGVQDNGTIQCNDYGVPYTYLRDRDINNNDNSSTWNTSVLSWSIVSAGNYTIECDLFSTSAASTTGVQYNLSVNNKGYMIFSYQWMSSATTPQETYCSGALGLCYNGATSSITTGQNTRLSGVIDTGGTLPVLVNITMRPEINVSLVTAKMGTFCEVTKI